MCQNENMKERVAQLAEWKAYLPVLADFRWLTIDTTENAERRKGTITNQDNSGTVGVWDGDGDNVEEPVGVAVGDGDGDNVEVGTGVGIGVFGFGACEFGAVRKGV